MFLNRKGKLKTGAPLRFQRNSKEARMEVIGWNEEAIKSECTLEPRGPPRALSVLRSSRKRLKYLEFHF